MSIYFDVSLALHRRAGLGAGPKAHSASRESALPWQQACH
jgi:hypothetical protein